MRSTTISAFVSTIVRPSFEILPASGGIPTVSTVAPTRPLPLVKVPCEPWLVRVSVPSAPTVKSWSCWTATTVPPPLWKDPRLLKNVDG
jgi:hypothetical protein